VFDGIQLIVSTTISVVYAQLQVSQLAFDNTILTALVKPFMKHVDSMVIMIQWFLMWIWWIG